MRLLIILPGIILLVIIFLLITFDQMADLIDFDKIISLPAQGISNQFIAGNDGDTNALILHFMQKPAEITITRK
jgi:hypothetical protein